MTADPTTTLAAHADFIHRGTGHRCCTCGMWESDALSQGSRESFAAHVLEVLSATHAIIELPEVFPDHNTDYYQAPEGWMVETPDYAPGCVAMEGEVMAPEDARNLAVALPLWVLIPAAIGWAHLWGVISWTVSNRIYTAWEKRCARRSP